MHRVPTQQSQVSASPTCLSCTTAHTCCPTAQQQTEHSPLSIQGRWKHYLNTSILPQTNKINSKVWVLTDGGCEIHEQDKCGHSFLSEKKAKH